jgi:hypothetical protein
VSKWPGSASKEKMGHIVSSLPCSLDTFSVTVAFSPAFLESVQHPIPEELVHLTTLLSIHVFFIVSFLSPSLEQTKPDNTVSTKQQTSYPGLPFFSGRGKNMSYPKPLKRHRGKDDFAMPGIIVTPASY